MAVLVLGVFALTLLLSTQSFVREESLHIGKRILNTRNGILKVDINSDVPKVGHLRSLAVEPRDSILKADIDSDVPKVGNLRSLTAVFTASASSDPCLGLKDCECLSIFFLAKNSPANTLITGNLFNVPEGQDPFGQASDQIFFANHKSDATPSAIIQSNRKTIIAFCALIESNRFLICHSSFFVYRIMLSSCFPVY